MSNTNAMSESFNVADKAKEIETILREAGRQARIMHKKLGNPIASWENGKVVIIPPEEIPIEDEGESAK